MFGDQGKKRGKREPLWLLQLGYLVIVIVIICPVVVIVYTIYRLFSKARDLFVRAFGILAEGTVTDALYYMEDGEDCVNVTYSFQSKNGKTYQGKLRECHHALYWT
ncbi:MAG: hypothetical protein GY832_00395 [Chloroflexi bacterium]|nr:hypothetical protein [Chloroflexota bacterium]